VLFPGAGGAVLFPGAGGAVLFAGAGGAVLFAGAGGTVLFPDAAGCSGGGSACSRRRLPDIPAAVEGKHSTSTSVTDTRSRLTPSSLSSALSMNCDASSVHSSTVRLTHKSM
jgi:hypothetical protein